MLYCNCICLNQKTFNKCDKDIFWKGLPRLTITGWLVYLNVHNSNNSAHIKKLNMLSSLLTWIRNNTILLLQ